MAPLTRNASSLVARGRPGSARQDEAEETWEFASFGNRSQESRDNSVDPGMDEVEGMDESNMELSLLDPDKFEAAVYPLRAAADRVGREVEKFAEQLDRLNPQLHKENTAERYKSTLELVDEYHLIATAAVERLRSKHAPKRQQQVHSRWRQRIEGLKRDGALVRANDSFDGEEEPDGDPTGRGISEPSQTTLDDLRHWEQEKRTWDLFRRLLELQPFVPDATTSKKKKEQISAMGEIHRFTSEETIWDKFLIEDSVAKQRQIVVNWLEDTAESSGQDIDILVEQLEGGADRGKGLWAHGWLYTKEAIKAQKRLRSWPQTLNPNQPGISASLLNSDKTEALVTQLDPDAAARQSHVLEKPDEYFERAIWLACWEMLRRGRDWSHIREWCKDRVEGWRAVSLRGGLPAWDDMIDGMAGQSDRMNPETGNGSKTVPNIQGNRSKALWRRMCFTVARNGGLDNYERAVYGLISGDLESVLKVCVSWDDHVYAHYNSLLLSQFDAYLQSEYPDRLPPSLAQRFPLFDSVQYHGEPGSVGKRLVDALKINEITRSDAMQSMKMIQGEIIGGTFGEFVYQQGLALSQAANRESNSKIIPPLPEMPDEASTYIALDDYDGLRVITHMFLVYQDLNLAGAQGNELIAIENVIVAYIDFLRLAGKLLMIPLYASRLSPERQILTLGRVLLCETASSRRKELVRLMHGLGIDVPQVILMQLRFILSDLGYQDPDKFSITTGILHELKPGSKTGRQIRSNFVGEDVNDDDSALIRSFEWFLLVENQWELTFKMGVILYKRFFSMGHLGAAGELLKRMPSSLISTTKTGSIIGKSVDVSAYVDGSDEEEELAAQTPRATRSGRQQEQERARRKEKLEKTKMKTRVLADQAKVYTELEALIRALVALENWRSTLDETPSRDLKKAKSWRSQLRGDYDEVVMTVAPLLQDWLVDVPSDEEAGVESIRNSYIPDVVIAYNSVLQFAGHTLSRDSLIESLNLSTLVAAQDSDILSCFVKTGRVTELVTAFAVSSKSMLKANEQGPSKGRRKRGGMGESLAVWQVKP